MRLSVLLCFLLLTASWGAHVCVGQSYIDLASVNYIYGLPVKAEDPNNTRVTLQDVAANVFLPIPRKNGDAFLVGLNGIRNGQDWGSDALTPPNFYEVYAPLGYKWQFSEKWDMTALALPKISSDFEDLSDEDYQIAGLMLFSKQAKEHFKYKLGAYVSREYFGMMFVPIFGLDWRIGEKWEAFGNLPINATLLYKAKEQRLHAGLHFVASIRSFRFSETLGSPYMHKSTNELYGFTDLYLTKNIVIRGMAGFSVLRSYRTYAEDDQLDATLSLLKFGPERNQLNTDFADGAVLRGSLIYRYPLPKK